MSDIIDELVLYDNLIGKAIDEIDRLQRKYEPTIINPVASEIEKIMNDEISEAPKPAAGPWNYDVEKADDDTSKTYLWRFRSPSGHYWATVCTKATALMPPIAIAFAEINMPGGEK